LTGGHPNAEEFFNLAQRASVGSTEAANEVVARFGVIDA
jgi:hypothetical protein